jgi:hypothetical protein
VVIGVRVDRRAVRVKPTEVDAFLPLRFSATNETGRRVTLRISGAPLLQLGAGLTASQDVEGGPPRRIVLRAGHGRRAVVRVRSG